MYWSGEEWMLLITGVLFAAAAAAGAIPIVTLTRRSQLTFAAGATAFIVAAIVLAQSETVVYPPLLWLVPLLPAAILAVITRDAVFARRAGGAATGAFQDHLQRAADVRRASVIPVATATAGSPAERMLRMRASDPTASPQELARIAYAHADLRALVAGNPATPVSLLEWLASVGDSSVHAAISTRRPAVA
ncbi:hypothetical protein [Demequina sp. NBRC 110055]|uniref:variant leucine-rich repeat-containing protein n=1 Tax=Demequina sp. NBRC 110055 TaxID=1570344 RepID=UPI00118554D9|nr:hypothetical protein [Demequina sp. NBRC 110055]